MTLGLAKLMVDTIEDTRNEEGTRLQHSKCITLAYRLVKKEVETLGITSMRERFKLFKTLSWLTYQHRRSSRHFATHWPKFKAEALVYSLRDKLAHKSVEALGNTLANL